MRNPSRQVLVLVLVVVVVIVVFLVVFNASCVIINESINGSAVGKNKAIVSVDGVKEACGNEILARFRYGRRLLLVLIAVERVPLLLTSGFFVCTTGFNARLLLLLMLLLLLLLLSFFYCIFVIVDEV